MKLANVIPTILQCYTVMLYDDTTNRAYKTNKKDMLTNPFFEQYINYWVISTKIQHNIQQMIIHIAYTVELPADAETQSPETPKIEIEEPTKEEEPDEKA